MGFLLATCIIVFRGLRVSCFALESFSVLKCGAVDSKPAPCLDLTASSEGLSPQQYTPEACGILCRLGYIVRRPNPRNRPNPSVCVYLATISKHLNNKHPRSPCVTTYSNSRQVDDSRWQGVCVYIATAGTATPLRQQLRQCGWEVCVTI